MSLSRTAHCPARVSEIRYAQLYIGFGISARGIHSDVGFMPQPNLLTGFNPAYKSATLLHSFDFAREILDSTALEVSHRYVVEASTNKNPNAKWNQLTESNASTLGSVLG